MFNGLQVRYSSIGIIQFLSHISYIALGVFVGTSPLSPVHTAPDGFRNGLCPEPGATPTKSLAGILQPQTKGNWKEGTVSTLYFLPIDLETTGCLAGLDVLLWLKALETCSFQNYVPCSHRLKIRINKVEDQVLIVISLANWVCLENCVVTWWAICAISLFPMPRWSLRPKRGAFRSRGMGQHRDCS